MNKVVEEMELVGQHLKETVDELEENCKFNQSAKYNCIDISTKRVLFMKEK